MNLICSSNNNSSNPLQNNNNNSSNTLWISIMESSRVRRSSLCCPILTHCRPTAISVVLRRRMKLAMIRRWRKMTMMVRNPARPDVASFWIEPRGLVIPNAMGVKAKTTTMILKMVLDAVVEAAPLPNVVQTTDVVAQSLVSVVVLSPSVRGIRPFVSDRRWAREDRRAGSVVLRVRLAVAGGRRSTATVLRVGGHLLTAVGRLRIKGGLQ